MTIDEYCKEEMRLLAEFRRDYLADKRNPADLNEDQWIDMFMRWLNTPKRTSDAKD